MSRLKTTVVSVSIRVIVFPIYKSASLTNQLDETKTDQTTKHIEFKIQIINRVPANKKPKYPLAKRILIKCNKFIKVSKNAFVSAAAAVSFT